MDPRELDRSLPFLLHDITRLMRRNFHRRAQSLGMTQAQYRALAHLARNEGTNQVALAEVLDIQPITLARIVDRLAECGLVERRPVKSGAVRGITRLGPASPSSPSSGSANRTYASAAAR